MSEISKLNGYDIKDKKSVRTYDNVSLMKSDTTIKEGQHIKTRGYYNINDGGFAEYVIMDDDTLISDDGSIHELENGLKAVLIVDKEINIKQFGATENEEVDNTQFINKAIEYAHDKNISILIPKGIFTVNDVVILYSNTKLHGIGKYLSIIKDTANTEKSTPMITTSNFDSLTNYAENIILSDFTITSNGIRSVYDIELYNIRYSEIHDIYFNRLNCINNNADDLHGIKIERSTQCLTESYVNKIYNNTIRQGKILIKHSTDNYINNNEIWAPNCQNSALELNWSTNNSITNNQIVGGFVYGGIYFSYNSSAPTTAGNKIINNYFDGSYSNVNSAYGIYSDSNLEKTIISNNLFYAIKKSSIFIDNSKFIRDSIISNNEFESNRDDDSYSDISILDSTNTNGLVINSNVFYANNKTNKGYPIEYNGQNSNLVSKTIISNNVVNYASGYNTYDFYKSRVILQNNSPLLGTDNNSDYIVAQQTSSQAFTDTGLLNITSEIKKYGNGITLNNNVFTINSKSGISAVEINANVLAYGTLNQNKEIRILKNGNTAYVNQSKPSANNFNLGVNAVITVSEGDTISIQVVAANDNTTTTVGSTSTNMVSIKAIK